ncbi:MAG: MlaD family protein [Bryobacteraceae bacterium]|jgi:phospholipid/cholesterol/gamma-HCH transport system substrate-binding protein
MAERSKLRWSQLKVGLVGMAGFSILFVFIFLLTSNQDLFHRTAILKTYMDDASGLVPGTSVRLNGIAIGEVEGVTLTNSGNPKRTVEFTMTVRSEFLPQIPVDSVVGIAAVNLLGDKFLDITKGHSSQTVKDGAELAALETQDIPQLMNQMALVLKSFQTITGRVDNMLAGIEQGKGNIGMLLKDDRLMNSLDGIASEGQQLMKDIRSGDGTIHRLIYDPALYNELRSPLQRIDAMLADLQAGKGTAGLLLKDPSLFDEAHKTLVEIHQLVAQINAGQGSVGKLIKDDHLYSQLDLLVGKFNLTMDKIDSGQGSLGQFLTNPRLYEALTGATQEFQSLAKDVRANPKKFLTIRLTLF